MERKIPLYELEIPNVVRPSRCPTVQDGVVIIDNGSYELRAGFGSESLPVLQFPNQLIKPRSRWTNDLESVVGDRNVSIRGFDFGRAAVRSPFDGNVVVNFETEEAILDYVFDRLGFQTSLEDHPLVMTECLLNPTYSRNTMMELLFESYGVQKVVFLPDCLGAYYYNQRAGNCGLNGVLLSSGHSATHVVPMVDGKAMLYHAQRSKICGYESTRHLQQLTLLHNPQCAGSLSKRNVELMKEQCTLCSQDYIHDLEKIQVEEHSAGGYGMRVQLPRAVLLSGNGNEGEIETPVDKTLKAEEQRNRLRAMSLRRKQKLLQEKQELLKYLKEIQIQVAETEAEDILESILAEAEVESIKELEKLMKDTEASIERLSAPSSQKKQVPEEEEDIETVRARLKDLTEQLESKKRSRMSASGGLEISSNKRVSSEQRRRMKLVAEAAALEEDDDDFGADDRDWDVYKEMDPHNSDSEIEKQTEVQLLQTRNKLRDMGEDIGLLLGEEKKIESELDENQVYLSVERIRVPELLFQPCLMGIDQAGVPEIISEVLKSLPREFSSLCEKEILVYGGNTAYSGLETRLFSELRSLSLLGHPMVVKQALDRFLDAWHGAALFSRDPGAFDHGYSLQDYQEMGLEALERKPLPFIYYNT